MTKTRFLFFLSLFSTIPQMALSYIGPGMAISTVLIVLGVVGSLLLGVLSVIYYPVKRLIKKTRYKKKLKRNK